ncbi:WecB/TagA/CpsF family glycosyltransferase [Fibrobacterota bacterium]
MKQEEILGMKVNPLTYERAVSRIEKWLKGGGTKFVSVAPVYNLVCALRDPELMEIENQADMVTTDGMPLVWILKSRGYRDCGRVYGPVLMLKVLEMAEAGAYPVYFYGCTDEVLALLSAKLKARYPGLVIAGYHAPPFRPLTEEENQTVVDKIAECGARIVFVGLSSPKQERWMFHNRNKLENCVMLGVGAAFMFHAGKVRQAPPFIQGLGLEWLFRLVMEPKRLWRRYLFGNSYFIWRLIRSRFQGKGL